MDMSLGDELEFIVCSRKKKYLLQAPMTTAKASLRVPKTP